jgi:hypothetical protein
VNLGESIEGLVMSSSVYEGCRSNRESHSWRIGALAILSLSCQFRSGLSRAWSGSKMGSKKN